MSAVRELGVRIWGNASGYIGAVNQTLYGTTRLSQGFRSATRDSQLMSNQMKAMATTMRYALAGGLLFGITGAISKLNQFNQQLGTINSLAAKLNKDGQLKGLGSQIEDVGSQAILLSNKLGIAVNDVEDYMARFYSSFDAPKGKAGIQQMSQFVEQVAKLQAFMGAEAGDPQQLAGGVAGFIHSMPGGSGLKDIGKSTKNVSNLIAYLTQKTPNITGADVARDIGRLGAGMNITKMTPEQVFAVWGLAGMAGGSSSVIGRGVSQLLTYGLINPKTPLQKKTYSAMGLPTDPTTLRDMGGMNVLMQMMQYVQGQGPNMHVGNLKSFSGASFKNLGALQNQVGGLNVTPIFNAFGRIQSVQQFINLMAQGGPKALQSWIDSLKKAEKENLAAQRYNIAQGKRGLVQFSTSMSNLGLSLVRGVETPIESIGRVAQFASNELAKHRTATTIGVDTTLGLATTRLLAKTGLFGGISNSGGTGALDRAIAGATTAAGARGISGKLVGLKALRGLGRIAGVVTSAQSMAAQQAILAEEAPGVLGGTGADGSRANPFWVIISPYSQYVSGMGAGSAMSSTTTPSGGGGSGFTSVFKRVPTVLPWMARAIPDIAALTAIQQTAGWQQKHIFGPLETSMGMNDSKMSFQQAEKVKRALDRLNPAVVDQAKALRIEGEAKGNFTIKLVDANGNIIATTKAQAPVKIWGPSATPTAQGKAGKR